MNDEESLVLLKLLILGRNMPSELIAHFLKKHAKVKDASHPILPKSIAPVFMSCLFSSNCHTLTFSIVKVVFSPSNFFLHWHHCSEGVLDLFGLKTNCGVLDWTTLGSAFGLLLEYPLEYLATPLS